MFSLRMLLAVVAISAVYIAAMMLRTEWWEAGILKMTYVIFAGAMTGAILSREHRAFFVAFALFGVSYGLLFWSGLGGKLIGGKVIEKVADDLIQNAHDTGSDFNQAVEQSRAITSIGHLAFAFLISLVAGVVAEAVVRRSKANGPTVAK